jgi:hypothetical protein
VRKCADSDFDHFIDEIKKMRDDRQQVEKESDERLYLLEKQKIDLEQERNGIKIMDTDTSTMDKESQLYFKLKKEEIVMLFRKNAVIVIVIVIQCLEFLNFLMSVI